MARTPTPMQRTSFLHRHRFALAFFLYVVLYNVVIVNRLKLWAVDRITYSYHAVDFSCGFATKLLPGAIFNALFGAHVSEQVATVFETVLMLLFFAGTAILLERLCLRAPQEHRNAAVVLVLFYLSGAHSFAVFTDELGILDVYWLYFSLLFFFFLEHRWLRFLIPLLYVASVLVHFSALLNVVILFSILLLYRVSVEESGKERRVYAGIFAVSVLAAAGLSLFFMLKEKSFLCDEETFHEIMRSHGSEYFNYYDYAFFDTLRGEVFIPAFVHELPSAFLRIVYTVYYRLLFNFKLMRHIGSAIPFAMLEDCLILAPVLAILFRFHGARFKRKGNRLGQFCSFLMLVQFPFTVVSGLLFSIDVNRWVSHAFLIAFGCLFTILYKEEDTRSDFLAQLARLIRPLPAKIYFLAYATINFWPYF